MHAARVAFLCQIAALCVGVSLAQEPAIPDEQLFVELEQSLAVGASTLAPDLQRLRVAAASGDAASQLLLGRYLYEGRRTARQVAQGLSLLELAAAAGLSDASYLVGEAYRNGVIGMRRQPARALRHYEAAAEAGNKAAGRALAGLLLDQRYAFADRARGLQILEDLAAEGDVQALLALGAAYSGVDGPAAINAYGRAAAGGSTSALNSLGDIYRRGAPGVPADLDKALEYYELLGRVGDQGARRKTADIFIRDEGGKQDIARAVAILRSLVSAGDAQASIAIGDLYARGEFTPIDSSVAISAYRQAADAGLIDAYVRLGDFFRSGTVGMRPDIAMAISVYKEAAAKKIRGYSAALVRLADLFRTGADGLAPDGMQASAYYEQAIALDDDGARRSLAGMLLEGALVPRDAELAIKYLTNAAERGDPAAAMQLGNLYGRGGAIEADYNKSVRFYQLAADLGETSAPLRQAVTLADGPLAADHRRAGVSFLAEGVAKGLPGAATAITITTRRARPLAHRYPYQEVIGDVHLVHGSLGKPSARDPLRTTPFLMLALVVGVLWAPPSPAADLGASVTLAPSDANTVDTRATTLSNLLSLLLVRVTFDVMAIEDVLGRVEDRIIAWGGANPSDGERDEIERQLLAEASYYIVSLRYLIQVGGAAFPPDRPESDYANDTLVRLDSLERKLFDQLAAHEEVEGIIREVEAIRLLTEGSAELTSSGGYFTQHQQLLEAAKRLSRRGLPT